MIKLLVLCDQQLKKKVIFKTSIIQFDVKYKKEMQQIRSFETYQTRECLAFLLDNFNNYWTIEQLI